MLRSQEKFKRLLIGPTMPHNLKAINYTINCAHAQQILPLPTSTSDSHFSNKQSNDINKYWKNTRPKYYFAFLAKVVDFLRHNTRSSHCHFTKQKHSYFYLMAMCPVIPYHHYTERHLRFNKNIVWFSSFKYYLIWGFHYFNVKSKPSLCISKLIT